MATEWRGKVPPAVMEELFWQVAGPLAGDGSDDDDDGGPVLVLGGMPVCGTGGMLVALADTPANRAMPGCTGTRHQKGPGPAPFGQLLAVVMTARAGAGRGALIPTLLDHHAVAAGQVRGTYQSRWSASETTFGEDKTTIAGAGDRTSGPVLRSGSPRLVIQGYAVPDMSGRERPGP